MYSRIVKNIFLPLYEMKLPSYERYIKYINLLDRTQWWSYADLEEFQLKRLRKLLHHANNNVPFYHKLFKKVHFEPSNVTSVHDLNELPILTKEIINKNFDNLYATNYSKKNLILFTTSGSTGTPMRFFINKHWDACNMAAAHRAWNWAGYELGNKIAYLWGAQRDFQSSRAIDKIHEYVLRTKKLDAYNLTEENMTAYAGILRKFKPKIINTYSSVIFLFSEFLNKEGIHDINPNAILTTADMLYSHQRRVIEEVFNCNVFDYYSGRDTSLQAAECNQHNGYHLSIENAVVEFIKEDGLVSPGETGKIIITDLCNYAMPFIRYEIGDLGCPSDEKCSCGRNLPLMKTLKGRIFDFIITPEGKRIPGEYFHSTIINYNIFGIKEFQILQNSKHKLTVYIVKSPNAKTNEVDRFINIIQNEIGEEIEIKLEYVSSIKRTPTGKLRHVISNVDRYNKT